MRGGFWQAIGKYAQGRAELVFSLCRVGGVVGAGMAIVFSISQARQRESVLFAGGSPRRPESYQRAAIYAARGGEYGLAEKIYERGKVLGAQAGGDGVEDIVYPERRRARLMRRYAEVLSGSPYYPDALMGMAIVAGEEKREELQELLKWIAPN